MMNIRKLPIRIQDFEKLRNGNYVYADKTEYVYRMTSMDQPYFLTRPRRLGKSLFLSTLKAYFLGKKELFEGLSIAEFEKEWIEYPVFYLDFNIGIYADVNSPYQTLDYLLSELEEKWGAVEKEKSPSMRFKWLIQRAYKQTGRKVVILIDEYDKPLLGTIEKQVVNSEIRDVLKGFYGVLKSVDAYLRFVLLTEVTKFSQVIVFSDLNHLKDISTNEKYSAVCGITQTELIEYFEPEIL